MAVGYLHRENNNTVIELYFSSWQAYVFHRSAETVAMATAQAIPATARAPAEGDAPHSRDRGREDRGWDQGGHGHRGRDWGMPLLLGLLL